MLKSTEKHRKRFEAKKQYERSLEEVKLLLKTISAMDLQKTTKKRMLNRVLWLAVELTGNFRCRYRSKGVLSQMGVKIQRDHVHPRKALIAELLERNPNFDSIVERAATCCVVTIEEHRSLNDVDVEICGWDRYKAASVEWFDMEKGDYPHA